MRYLTDGTHLYEVAAQRTVQNYGLRRGVIRYTIIRDVVSEATATVDELQLAALDPKDPRLAAFEVYGWLGAVQESLVHALAR